MNMCMALNKKHFHTITHKEDETKNLGERLGQFLLPGDIVALSGTTGAGKTILAKGIALALNIKEVVTSPTFTIISEYEGKLPLYHMDLYRISSPEEFSWLGTREMLYGKGICVLEWSENAGDNLPDYTLRVNIEILEKDSRKITINSKATERKIEL